MLRLNVQILAFNRILRPFSLCCRKNMSKVVVRCLPSERNMTISFKMRLENSKEDTAVNFIRAQDEQLSKSLERICINVQKKLLKHKKNKDDDLHSLNVYLMRNEKALNIDLPNAEAWLNGAVLHVGDSTFEVLRNPPMVKSIFFPDNIMAGFPIYPNVEVEFCDILNSEFQWHRESTGDNVHFLFPPSTSNSCNESQKVWNKVSDTLVYIPTYRDIGRCLRFVCIPVIDEQKGQDMDVLLPPVDAGPGFCPFENRHAFTRKLTKDGSYRVVTYNILADVYARTMTAHKVLFSHCPPYALKMSYRIQLILKEVLGYKADLICLQEVDNSIYKSRLVPALSFEGFKSEIKLKGDTGEGLAIFYRESKFRLLATHDIFLAKALTDDDLHGDFFKSLSENQILMQTVLTRTTCLQVAIFECKDIPHKMLCVANTHLYFAPDANNIRLVQAAICMKHIENIMQHYVNEYPEYKMSLVFCGDFNSRPSFGVYKFMIKGELPYDFHEITCVDEQSIPGMTLCHPFRLDSACGIPKYTNYVPGFVGTLDYIFYDCTSFKVTRTIPMPTDEEVTCFQALPNLVFPSDHIALISDITWIES